MKQQLEEISLKMQELAHSRDYEMAGNSIVVNVLEEILRNLLRS